MSTWFNILSRRKPIPTSDNQDSNQLARVLNTLDLTALGIGSTLGVGVYVLAGHVAKDEAGPAVILSFLIAAVASVFAGLCYAEFGARVPRAGSAYIYSYVCVGEFIAFIIGWNLILEYVIGSASVAKGLSIYLDTLLNNTMRNAFIDVAPIDSPFMSEYFDFFSFAITLVLGAALAFGLKESSLANNIFTAINILVVIFVIIAGGIKANPANWNIKNETILSEYNAGKGGFLPFGIEGVIKGAATCFYGFIGFDCIATTGEEVRNPQKAIPISIILSLFIVFLSYFGTSAIVTLMVPYYLQDPDAPIPHAFVMVGWDWAKWIVSIGGIFGLCASLFGAMFPLPRIIYAMANDALVFRFLGTVNERFRTPVVGTILAAILTGLMSSLFNLKQLVNMMSIGTLMAYTIVAACVIILRYSVNEEQIAEWKYSLLRHSDPEDEYSDFGNTYEANEDYTENLHLIPPKPDVTVGKVFKLMFDFSPRNPDYLTQRLVTTLVFLFCVLSLILACLLSYLKPNLENGELYAVIPTIITVIFMLVIVLAIWAQPTVHTALSFKVPLVPLVPALSICINIYLMLMLDGNTWIRFGIWMAIGLPIYFTSCKLYSKLKTNTTKSNGHINTSKENGSGFNKKNGSALTIPEIIVIPPLKLNELDSGSITKETLRKRSPSVDSSELTNAVLEIDKVLYESESELNNHNFEAINPENELKNIAILTKNMEEASNFEQKDNISLCSSNTESIHSKEHHIVVQIHQEDSDESKSDTSPDLKTGKTETVRKQSTDNIIKQMKIEDEDEIQIDNLDEAKIANETQLSEKDNNSDTVDTITDDKLNTDLDVKENMVNKVSENVTEELSQNDIFTIKEDDNNETIDVTIKALQQNSDDNRDTSNTKMMPDKDDIIESEEEEEEEEEGGGGEEEEGEGGKAKINNIPPPPPIEGLLDENFQNTLKLPMNRPLISAENLGKVQLRSPKEKARKRTQSTGSTTSEGPIDNVTSGTTQYEKIRSKLNTIFQNKISLPVPNTRYLDLEDKAPSPTTEKDLQAIDHVLEQYENEIPENFGKSKEFKNELNNLLLRRHSSNLSTRPDYSEKQLKDNDNSSKTDETKHRKLMANSLKSIKLKKTGIFEESDEEDVDNEEKDSNKQTDIDVNNEKTNNENIEKSNKSKGQYSLDKDREKHKRLMIGTLRNIKLRKTGLNLNEESVDQSDNNVDR